jgi:hypothetical protein
MLDAVGRTTCEARLACWSTMSGTRRWRAVAVIGAAIALVGCAEQACSVVGCQSGVSFDLSAFVAANPATPITSIELCVDDTCRTPDAAEPAGAITVPVTDVNVKDRYRIKVTGVVGPAAAATLDSTLAWTMTQPNGPKCPPRCWHTSVRVGADGTLSASR